MTPEELQFVLGEGEGQKIEFKESASSLDKLDKELAAFATATGGRIFLGVTDENEVKGISVTNELRSKVQDIAHNCQPSIKIVFEEVDGVGNVLVVNVPEGDDKPYCCSSGCYIRVGPNSQKMTRNQIIEFSRQRGESGSMNSITINSTTRSTSTQISWIYS